MPTKQIVHAEGAPKPIGPYSSGVLAGQYVFTSGQAGVDPATGKLVEGGIEAQTRQTLSNIAAILQGAGSSLANVLKTTVFLASMDDFQAMNRVYAEFFGQNPPARTTVQAARLPMGALVEIEAIALKE